MDVRVWHPFTTYPLTGNQKTFTKAQGAYVFDDKGNKYFDATSSWWCNLHGHCHPRLVEALHRQAQQLDQVMFAPHTHPIAMELASRLIDKLGKPFERIFFSDDGSTAVEAALKMTVQYWRNRGERRERFLSLEMGYHGDTMGAVSVGHIDQYHGQFAGITSQGFRGTAPYCYRCPLGLSYPSCGVKCVESAETILRDRHREIAAFIVEPLILGAGGMIVYPKEYVERLVRLCNALEVPVIFDEVFTGFGRTGTFFAKEQIAGTPDIICLSKGLTSGMLPLAVTAVTGRIFEAFTGGPEKTFYHGHTFTANALGCAVAVESLKIFDEDNVLERNRALSELMAAQTPRFRTLERVGDVRQVGMIWAAELKVTGRGWPIANAMLAKGIWARPLHNVIYCIPPYASTEADLASFFSVLYSELQDEQHFS